MITKYTCSMNAVWLICFCVAYVGAKDSKDNEFVEIVKMNLRRNNEDYVDTTNSRSQKPTAPNRRAGRRRGSDQEDDLDYYDGNTTTDINNILLEPSSKARYPIDKETVNKNMFNQFKKIAEVKEKTKTTNVEINISMQAPVNKTVDASDNEPEQYLSNVSAEHATKKKTIFVKKPLRHKSVGTKKYKEKKKFVYENKKIMRNGWDFKSNLRERKKSILENATCDTIEEEMHNFQKKLDEEKKALEDKVTPIDNRELDMYPAVGGRVRLRRERGRLCYRSVLLPEGPKYDEQGRPYRPALALRPEFRFDVTRAPRLILPRCCNCCKKSVLGCE